MGCTSEWATYHLLSALAAGNAILLQKFILSLVIGNLNLFFAPDPANPREQILDDPFGRRRARRHPHAGNAGERFRRELGGGFDMMDPRIEFPADLRQAPGVGAVVSAQDDHRVRFAGDRGRLLLPQHGRVTDRVVDPDFRDLPEGDGNEFHEFLERLGRLGDDPHLPDPGRLLEIGQGGEDGHAGLDVADDAFHLGVVRIPDDGDRIAFAAQPPGILLSLLHEGASGVDDLHVLRGQRVRVAAGDAVGADDDLPAGDVVHGRDHMHPFFFQLLHRLRVVDQGPQRMDGPSLDRRVAPGLIARGLVGDGDGPLHAEAKSRAAGDQNPFHRASTFLTASGSRRIISSTTSSTESVVVSMQIAPSATRNGECSRVLSWMSRRRTSRSTSSNDFSAAVPHSRKRRSARTAAWASRKNLASASGNTTVPVSRPSSTRPPRSPIFRCRYTIASRTCRCAETSDAPMLISGVRIESPTSAPLSRIRNSSPSPRRNSRGRSAHSLPSRAPSDHWIPSVRAARAQARYIAPVSRRRSDARCASLRETVVLPAPEGPSIVTIGRSLTRAPIRAARRTPERKCRCSRYR